MAEAIFNVDIDPSMRYKMYEDVDGLPQWNIGKYIKSLVEAEVEITSR